LRGGCWGIYLGYRIPTKCY